MRSMLAAIVCGIVAGPLLVAAGEGLTIADAARGATTIEHRGIKEVVLSKCPTCTYMRGATRISTRNPRFAVAIGSGRDSDYRVVVRRSTPKGKTWKPTVSDGGNPNYCSAWRRQVPRSVLREFDIRGFVGEALVRC